MRPPRYLLCLLGLLTTPPTDALAGDFFLVRDGKPLSEIVISENPPATVRLAAHDLQQTLAKISDARLPITTVPHPEVPVQVYVGRSAHADKLEVTTDTLENGAYRMVSGRNWLVLLGDDAEFTPVEPWARHNADITSGRPQAEWDKITGANWGLPNLLIYKDRLTLPGRTGLPSNQIPSDPKEAAKLPPLQIWDQSERGTYNAVCGFLQHLGVRWYMPGDLGEVLPQTPSIALPEMRETVRPDIPVRRINFRFAVLPQTDALWAMRLGLRNPHGLHVAHGMDDMTHRPELYSAHPEWFALYGGQRQNLPEMRLKQLCYSNPELFEETVRYVRAQFDQFHFDAVSVMPPDGYTAICQCPLCAGKDSPERNNRGLLSDYVWDFVNRVAREVAKTHPGKKITNCAYGVYTLPPLKIAKLEPNVQVTIVGGRRPMSNLPEEQEECRKLRESWLPKTDNPIVYFENYPFTDRGWYLPAYTPHSLGESINAVKGHALGEDIWLSIRQDFDKVALGFNHFPVYFTARMYWGGKQQDVDALFQEYCRLFYGPAGTEMLKFFTFCEAHWQEMEKDKTAADTALSLFARAKDKLDPESVFGRRLAHVDDFLKGLRSKSEQLGKIRGPVPQLRMVGEALGKITIDGKLDEEAWTKCPAASTGRLQELQTGRPPLFGTTVKTVWSGNNLYIAVRCEEHPDEKLNIGATRKDDAALWYGDAVEVLLETESRSYYQIAVSPSGAVADMDRSAPSDARLGWDAQAEVATDIQPDHWTLEMRIPVTQDENDPLHQVIGRKPTRSLPWHINICRQRIRESGSEYSAFSPTGVAQFHQVMKFATFYDGLSHTFDAGPPEPDYLDASRKAADLLRQGKTEDALEAYTAAAQGGFTEFQKSAALELAAAAARTLRQKETADSLASQIPVPAVQKAVRMQNLLDFGNSNRLLEEFKTEDIAKWPFWKAGDGYFARGRAFMINKAGKEAEADFNRALEWSSEPRLRDVIKQSLAGNLETNLADPDRALAVYREIVDPVPQLGTAAQFTAVQGMARILAQKGRLDDALAVLKRVDTSKIGPFWKTSIEMSEADALAAGGRREEAATAYRRIQSDPAGDDRLKPLAEKKAAEAAAGR
jgi:predicted negative regulator of RcsB-dependent stress response